MVLYIKVKKTAQNIGRATEERAFSSVNDLEARARIGDSTVTLLNQLGILKGMPKTDQRSLFD